MQNRHKLCILTLYIAPDKALFFLPKFVDDFLICPQKHMLWYSLEASASQCFHGEIMKILSGYAVLSKVI